jgi:hypothetical protein
MTIGKIYMLKCKTTGKTYIGSTQRTLKDRLYSHRSKFNLGVYCSSAQIIEGNNYQMIELEQVEFQDKYELFEREAFWIKSTTCVNKCIPNNWTKNNGNMTDYQRQYRKDNPTYFRDYQRDLRKRKKLEKQNIKLNL